jgi:hypothetical protein
MRQWQIASNKLPILLSENCLDYKRWKKYAKRPPDNSNIVRLLEHECERVDSVFRKHYRRCVRTKRSCLCQSNSVCKEDILLFAELNRNTLYKICKRLDKRVSPKPMTIDWLVRVRKELKFKFICGVEATTLNMTFPTKCPVCFDDVNEVVISKCGHILCVTCLESMYEMNGVKGTYHNIISCKDSEKARRCPSCRTYRPFDKMLFWPKNRIDEGMIIH